MKNLLFLSIVLSTLLFSCKKNPATVISDITGSFDVTFKGTSHHYTLGYAQVDNRGVTAVTGFNSTSATGQDGTVLIQFKGQTGNYLFGDENQDNNSALNAVGFAGASEIYSNTYILCTTGALINTDGHVTITSYGPVGGKIEGTFTGAVALVRNCTTETAPISGSFSVIRK